MQGFVAIGRNVDAKRGAIISQMIAVAVSMFRRAEENAVVLTPGNISDCQ